MVKYDKDNQNVAPHTLASIVSKTRPYSFLTPLKALAIASIPLTSFTCHRTRPVSNSNKATPLSPPLISSAPGVIEMIFSRFHFQYLLA